MKAELTPRILGMYVGRPCDVGELTIRLTPLSIANMVIPTARPHLRRLESITEDEAEDMYDIAGWSSGKWSKVDFLSNEPVINDYLSHEILIGNPAAWLYLLSRGFDLFGLIDAGLAKEVEQ